MKMLRYILFHHQTTTVMLRIEIFNGCVISSFITKPQLEFPTPEFDASCVISSFITKPQLAKFNQQLEYGCVISSFITKPQPMSARAHGWDCCVISSFITKPQLNDYFNSGGWGCVISSFITKPQHPLMKQVASLCCVISSFITKPQPSKSDYGQLDRCVISSFITKPQRTPLDLLMWSVALYPLSSPNHNLVSLRRSITRLRYILFHHQTTTLRDAFKLMNCCVISSFITKPQPYRSREAFGRVALYPLSSPNHNS